MECLDLEDELKTFELKYRDELISKGMRECRSLIGNQKNQNMYYFYEGSIEGFEECKDYFNYSDFLKRLKELHKEEKLEVCSELEDDELREIAGLYGAPREMDLKEVWQIKGRRTQIEFVYDKLVAYRLILGGR